MVVDGDHVVGHGAEVSGGQPVARQLSHREVQRKAAKIERDLTPWVSVRGGKNVLKCASKMSKKCFCKKSEKCVRKMSEVF
jgi:hypothetical protein